MSKIRKAPKRHTGRIPEKTGVKSSGLNFSFKYLDLNQKEDFSLDHGKDGYTKTLLERLRDMSGMAVGEFLKGHSLKTHPIDWTETAHPEGFLHLNEQLRDIPAWQFNLTKNEHGRVHGLLIDETFFVVWLDPDHRLYP